MSEPDDLIEALGPVVTALNNLKIPHYIGGSVASSFHGATRSTMDVDLVCELQEALVPDFLAQIDDRFYVSQSAVQQAVRQKSCFNLIHLPSSFKVDVFVSRQRAFDNDCMRRATVARLGDSVTIEVAIATAEDAIISKLEWYRMTDETSQRQWEDVSRLIRLLGANADTEYLTNAATSVGVTDLLNRLLDELR